MHKFLTKPSDGPVSVAIDDLGGPVPDSPSQPARSRPADRATASDFLAGPGTISAIRSPLRQHMR